MVWKRAAAVVVAVLAVGMISTASGVIAEGSPPATAAATTTTASGSATTITTSVRKLALGLSVLDYSNVGQLDSLTAQLGGHAPAIWSVWSDWGGSNATFPSDLVEQLRLRGVVPMVLWQPLDPSNVDGSDYTYQQILSGRYDTYIRTFATAAKASGSTILLRFAHEMDGTWFPWGVTRFDNTPARFKAAWIHVWNIFRGPGGVGATNVKFVWSPYNPTASLYPGDAYVDYVGFTAFNWGPPKGPWRSMLPLLSGAVKNALTFTHKPLIAAEFGTSPVGGNKTAWVKTGYPAVYAKLPQIAAIVYFDINMQPGQPDWRLESYPGALKAYANIVAQSAFQGGIPGKPAVAIDLPAATSTLQVPISWTVGDPSRVGIAGYFVSTSSVAPKLTTPGWTSKSPAKVTLSGADGTKTVYAWVKDKKGSISLRARATTLLTTP